MYVCIYVYVHVCMYTWTYIHVFHILIGLQPYFGLLINRCVSRFDPIYIELPSYFGPLHIK